jgi:hypothetical protein
MMGKNEKGLALTPSPAYRPAFGYRQNTAIGRYSARAGERALSPPAVSVLNPLGADAVPKKK